MSFKKDDKVTFVIEDIGTGGEGIGKVLIIVIFICRIGLYWKGFKQMVVITDKRMKTC